MADSKTTEAPNVTLESNQQTEDQTPPTPPSNASTTTNTGTGTESDENTSGDTNSDPDSKTGKEITDLDDALKVIEQLRRENARQRTTAKQTAADEARTEFANAIANALGLTPDETPDPDTQVDALTKQVETATATAKQATLELAIYRAAASAGADPARLLDSRSFLESVTDIEPADTKAIEAAIKTATSNNPSLKATQAVGPTTIDHTPGGHGQPRQSLEQALTQLHG